MIQLIGVKSHCDINIRQKFSIIPARLQEDLNLLLNAADEAVILSTCNRTEIYINSDMEKEELTLRVLDLLKWDKALIPYIFHIKEKEAVRHLMEVTCGFHSRICGEDQISGQVKSAYEASLKFKALGGSLQRLFQIALTCGKAFKSECEIYKIPVSFSSIAAKEALKRGVKSFMLIGFGDTGELAAQYLLSGNIDVLYIVVRDLNKYQQLPKPDRRVRFIGFDERKNYYMDVDCIISCTSAPHIVIHKEDLPLKNYLIFDLAVPKDVEEAVTSLPGVELYNIDSISIIDENNKLKRREKMRGYRYIIDKHIQDFMNWQSFNEISADIQGFKAYGSKVYSERLRVFNNKKHYKDKEKLAEILLKSTSDAYVNRAIEVLKEEKLKGREEECLKILRKIFLDQNQH